MVLKKEKENIFMKMEIILLVNIVVIKDIMESNIILMAI